jgi:hypothetical protein
MGAVYTPSGGRWSLITRTLTGIFEPPWGGSGSINSAEDIVIGEPSGQPPDDERQDGEYHSLGGEDAQASVTQPQSSLERPGGCG